jgi:hypothetical protein
VAYFMQKLCDISVISGFRRDVDEGQEVQVFLDFLTHEDGTDRFSRNVGKQLTHDAT